MRAIEFDTYGNPDVLRLRDVPEPVAGDDDLLVRVRAASVNPLDWHNITGLPYLVRISAGVTKPKDTRPGADMAGVVEAVGRNVTGFAPGDEVFGIAKGTFAEYVTVRATGVVAAKPSSLSFEQAAAVPVAALTALQGLRDRGGIHSGQKVLVIGASGGVGTFAVQIAKAYGAEVTGVCSTRNVDAVRSLGADHVIDYTADEFLHSGSNYDLILDVAGTRSVADRRRALQPKGTLVVVGGPSTGRIFGPMTALLKVLASAPLHRQKMVGMLTKGTQADLTTLRDLLASGQVTPVVERTYPLAETAEAVRYVLAGHARAKVVVAI